MTVEQETDSPGRMTSHVRTDAGAPAADPDIGSLPPSPVPRPLMLHRWDTLSFVHWPFEPADVARRLPPGLEIDTFDGAAWVGLIPFRLTITLPGVPSLPWASTFLETNVRTYVRGPDGRRGIWFLSLDAARLGAVLTARRSYHLPYVWSRLRMERDGRTIRYRGTRRDPTMPPAGYDITVGLDRRIDPADVGPLARFLTCRWRMFGPGAAEPGRTGFEATQVEHPPWPLWRAHPVELSETLLAASGFARPAEDPIVHFSPGVRVRLGRPEVLPGRESSSAA